jgi:putative iron-regulated protein
MFVLGIGLVVLGGGCGGSDDDDGEEPPGPMLPAGLSDSTVEMAVAGNASIAFSAYTDALNTANELKSAVGTFVGTPNMANLDAAKSAWLEAREAYQPTELYRLRITPGPIDALNDVGTIGEDGDGPEARINGWPLGEAFIDYVAAGRVDGDDGPENDQSLTGMDAPNPNIISDTSVTIDKETLKGFVEFGDDERNLATGYHAIEFLLWGQDLSADGPGARPVSDYVEAPRRVQYLHTAASQLVDDLQSLVEEWAPRQNGNYRTTFLAQEPNEALRQILVGIGTLSRSELAGERMAVALESHDQEDEHSCFSDNTHVDIVRNAQGIQNVIKGRYVRSNGTVLTGPGILALLQDGRKAELHRQMRNATAAVHTIQPPFDREIVMPIGRQRVQAAIHALRTQAEAIVNAAAALGIANLQVELPD